MNIHQILQEGSAVQLGPVEVTKTYNKNPGDKNRFLLIKDASGQGALKIWGAAANTNVNAGDIITLVGSGPKGGLKTSEYNGKTSIDANDCRLEFGNGHRSETQAPQHHAPAAQSGPAPSGGPDKLPAVMARCAEATRLYIDELVINQGFSKDEAIMLAQGVHSAHPLWWFGEKGLK